MSKMKQRRLPRALKGATAALVMASLGSAAVAAVGPNEIAHDQLWAIGDVSNTISRTFQPPIRIASGCVPFPAVTWEGKRNAGLDATGGYSSKCSYAPRGANVYYRIFENYGGYCVIAYAYYMPKDALIHRHDWEMALVWLNNKTCTSATAVTKLTVTRHGKLYHHDAQYLKYSGKAPVVEYDLDGATHGLFRATSASGGMKPTLVSYNHIPAAAQNALNASWGKAVFPLSDAKLYNSLDRAYRGRE